MPPSVKKVKLQQERRVILRRFGVGLRRLKQEKGPSWFKFLLERDGLPKIGPLMGGRFWPMPLSDTVKVVDRP